MLHGEVHEFWEQDSKIDISELAAESLNIPQLHGKYQVIRARAAKDVRALKAQLYKLRLEKYQFFTLGATRETTARGWKLPPQGKVLKTDAWTYVDNEADVQELTEQLALHVEGLEYVDDILTMIRNRSFHIKNAIEDIKHKDGVG